MTLKLQRTDGELSSIDNHDLCYIFDVISKQRHDPFFRIHVRVNPAQQAARINGTG